MVTYSLYMLRWSIKLSKRSLCVWLGGGGILKDLTAKRQSIFNVSSFSVPYCRRRQAHMCRLFVFSRRCSPICLSLLRHKAWHRNVASAQRSTYQNKRLQVSYWVPLVSRRLSLDKKYERPTYVADPKTQGLNPWGTNNVVDIIKSDVPFTTLKLSGAPIIQDLLLQLHLLLHRCYKTWLAPARAMTAWTL